MEKRGIITEIRRFATHDGPGIRTTVFFKGCPLRCKWCSNPETQLPTPELYFIAERAIEGECVDVCPEGAIKLKPRKTIERSKCSKCFECVNNSETGVFRKIGEEYSVSELFDEVMKDRQFYSGGGGVTLSGGEPLFQTEFTLGFKEKCRNAGLDIVLDTCGEYSGKIAERAAELANLVLFDVKHMDSNTHEKWTGIGNRRIIENAIIFAKRSKVRISWPLVPGFNDSKKNIGATAELAKTLNAEAVDIMPLHFLGTSKYRYLSRKNPYSGMKIPNKGKIIKAKEVFESKGLKTTIGRMM